MFNLYKDIGVYIYIYVLYKLTDIVFGILRHTDPKTHQESVQQSLSSRVLENYPGARFIS